MDFRPGSWKPRSAPKLEGDYEANSKLARAERWDVGGIGPEDVVVAYDGSVYTGLEDGRIVRISATGTRALTVAQTGGRPLGIELDAAGGLVICDARKGLLRFTEQQGLQTLVDTFDGEPLRFTNNAAIATDGTIYFTDSSQRHPIERFKIDILEHSGTGRLFAYRPDGQVDVLLEGLQFANGVALDPYGQFVLVAETGAYRVQKFWLAGDRAHEHEIFVDNLPGFPDNLSHCDGTFWVAIPSLRDPVLDATLPHGWIRRLIAYLPESLHPRIQQHGFVLGFDPAGRVIYNLQDSTGQVTFITGVRQFGRRLYLGGLHDSAISVLDLDGSSSV